MQGVIDIIDISNIKFPVGWTPQCLGVASTTVEVDKAHGDLRGAQISAFYRAVGYVEGLLWRLNREWCFGGIGFRIKNNVIEFEATLRVYSDAPFTAMYKVEAIAKEIHECVERISSRFPGDNIVIFKFNQQLKFELPKTS